MTRRRRLPLFITAVALVLGAAVPGGVAADEPEPVPKVAIIVGPVGSELTPVYLDLAETAAAAAEERGASVARAYSPEATPERVLDAVADATIVVYFGHGIGTPNPYSDAPNPAVVNGWGLSGPNPDPDHGDAMADGQLVYVGETWIAEHARPAPGWVMIYSNACYAPGAGEGQHPPADEATAAARVSAYSRVPLAELGASAYFATDFHAGAAHLVVALLDQPQLPYGELFASEPRHVPEAVAQLEHASVDGAQTWLQRSAYFGGQVDYWYAFAGDPTASFGGGSVDALTWLPGSPIPDSGRLVAAAAAYAETPGHEGQATVALASELAAAMPDGAHTIRVCADRCAELPVVADLAVARGPSVVGGAPPSAIALSTAAWLAVSDRPLGAGPLLVRIGLWPLEVAELPVVPVAPAASPAPLPTPTNPELPPPPPPPVAPSPAPTASSSPRPADPPSATPEVTPTPEPSPGDAAESPTRQGRRETRRRYRRRGSRRSPSPSGPDGTAPWPLAGNERLIIDPSLNEEAPAPAQALGARGPAATLTGAVLSPPSCHHGSGVNRTPAPRA